MNDNEQNTPWEFDAPKYYDFKHPEHSSQGDDSWFDKASVSPEVNRNRLRLRNRQQQQQQQHTFTLPHPSRPISVKPTMPSSSIITTHNPPPLPTSTRRDIFTALASTKNRPSISSSTFSKKLSTQQHIISSVPESSIQEQSELARPIITSSNQSRITTGRRDVVAELKRITDRFAKKELTPTEIATLNNNSNEEQDQSHNNNNNNNNIENQIDNENSNDNDKENVPPHERQQQQQQQQQEQDQKELLPPQPIQPRLPSLPSSENHSFWLQESNFNNDNDENENVAEDKNQQHYDDDEEPMQITLSGRSLHDELQGKRPDTTVSSAGTGRFQLDDNGSIVTDNQMDKQSKHSDKRKSFLDDMFNLLDNNQKLRNSMTDQHPSSLHRKGSVVMEEVANDESQALSNNFILNNNDHTNERRQSWYNDETITTMDQSQEDDVHPIDKESPFLAPPSTITTPSYRYQEQENKRDMSNVNKSVIERRPQRPIISLPSSSAPTQKKSRLSIMTTDQEIEEPREKEEEKEKVTEEEKTVEESTRMRQWLDDLPSQLDNTSIEKSRSVPQIKLTSSSSLSSLSTHKLRTSETNTNNDRYTSTPAPTTKTEKTGTTNNFDVLFERMATIRSELLQIAKTSAIKPAESDLMRNMERLKKPLQGRGEEDNDELVSSSFNISTIEQRIARARRAIEESKRDSQGWFSKNNDKKQVETSFSPPPPPLLPTPASMKRKSILQRQQQDDDNYSTTRSTYASPLLTTMRPNKVQKLFSTHPTDIINNTTTRRESMQHDISIAERVQNLKQAASRRASRVSIIPSYLPIEPTVPKSPRFATDTRSRLPT
ncbi:hypothetical protein INT45_009314 [Circinella minor]|uniref:Uncharacterized protein n=1 Tax=Circinella minor TaxID=1195481 RepID=A0A8H7RT26_9FUNG|nr:hypothetical protein INT45_009314 [Circinella minor]